MAMARALREQQEAEAALAAAALQLPSAAAGPAVARDAPTMATKATLQETILGAVKDYLTACEAEDGTKQELFAHADKVTTEMLTRLQLGLGSPASRPAEEPVPTVQQPGTTVMASGATRAPAAKATEGGLGSENRLPERDVKKESMNATSRAQAASIELCGKTQQKAERERLITACRSNLETLVQQRDVEDAAAPSDSGAADA